MPVVPAIARVRSADTASTFKSRSVVRTAARWCTSERVTAQGTPLIITNISPVDGSMFHTSVSDEVTTAPASACNQGRRRTGSTLMDGDDDNEIGKRRTLVMAVSCRGYIHGTGSRDSSLRLSLWVVDNKFSRLRFFHSDIDTPNHSHHILLQQISSSSAFFAVTGTHWTMKGTQATAPRWRSVLCKCKTGAPVINFAPLLPREGRRTAMNGDQGENGSLYRAPAAFDLRIQTFLASLSASSIFHLYNRERT